MILNFRKRGHILDRISSFNSKKFVKCTGDPVNKIKKGCYVVLNYFFFVGDTIEMKQYSGQCIFLRKKNNNVVIKLLTRGTGGFSCEFILFMSAPHLYDIYVES